MLTFKNISALDSFLNQNKDKTIGFVPTMGALHQGHLTLIKNAQQLCDIVICSIFVNPKQFNKKSDLDNYPKTIDRDIASLESVECDVVFIPSVEEIYPKNRGEKVFDFGKLATEMEGEHRPGHFNGVALVIDRFFEIIKPDFAFFGNKDFQQLTIINALVKKLNSNIKIIGCDTVREASGLAMSSRNERLTEDEKIAAAKIYKSLSFVTQNKKNHSVQELKHYYMENINNTNHLSVEYFEIADGNTLQPINEWSESNYPVAFTAVNVRDVRLIDNMTIIN